MTSFVERLPLGSTTAGFPPVLRTEPARVGRFAYFKRLRPP